MLVMTTVEGRRIGGGGGDDSGVRGRGGREEGWRVTTYVDVLGRVVVDAAANPFSAKPECAFGLMIVFALAIVGARSLERCGCGDGNGNGMRLLKSTQ